MNFSNDFEEKSSSFQDLGQIQIKDLYIELERKDLVIKNLQSQLQSLQSQSDIFINTKKEETSLKEKNFNTRIFQLEQIVKEKEEIIQSLQKEIDILNKNLLQKDEEMSELKQEGENNKITSMNYQLQLNSKDQQNKQNKLEYQNQIILLQKEKKTLEAKIQQLVEIIKQYSQELTDYSIHIESVEAEKKSLASLNKKLSEINKENMIIIKESKKEIESIDSLSKSNQNLTFALKKVQSELNDMQIEKDNYKKEAQSKDEIIKELRTQCVELSSFQKSFDEISNELLKYKSSYSQLEINNNINKNRADESENELSSLCININKMITTLVEWIETYFGVYFDYEIPKIPEIPLNKNININLLYDCLTQKRNNINISNEKYEKMLKDDSAQLQELLNKINTLQNENDTIHKNFLSQKDILSFTEGEVIKLKEVINDKEKELESLKFQYNDLNQYIIEYNDSIGNLIKNMINGILNNQNISKFFNEMSQKNANFEKKDDFIIFSMKNIMEFINTIGKEYENLLKIQKENDELVIEISRMQKSQEEERGATDKKIKLIEMNYNKEFQIIQTKNEQIIKEEIQKNINEMQSIVRSIDSENKKLKSTIKLYEKRFRNLQTEMDLKDIQIKSQEEIIQRRTRKENNVSTSCDEGIIKGLESDKEKLISDNILLINDNRYLQEQLEKLKNELTLNGRK